MRVPWTARRSKQSILKVISPEYSLEGLMLKLKLQYFGQLMRRADSLEKTLMLGKIEGGRRRGQQRMRRFSGITISMDVFEQTPGDGEGQGSLAYCSLWGLKESDTTERQQRARINDCMIQKGNTWAFFPEDCCLCRVLSWEAWHAPVHGVTKSQAGLND